MYFTKKINNSIQFYHRYSEFLTFEQYMNEWSDCLHVSLLPEHILKRYDYKIKALEQSPKCVGGVYFQMLNPTMEEKMEVINEDFRNDVNRNFKDIYFDDELGKLIFDADGNIRLLDEYLYLMIQYFTAKFNIIDIEASIVVLENKEKIINGSYSEGVKALAKAYMHESKVEFEIEKPHIVAYFGMALYHCPMDCRFHAVFNDNLRIFDCEIHESEVLINEDGTFQYNALVYTPNSELEEICIPFYDVVVEEFGYEGEGK